MSEPITSGGKIVEILEGSISPTGTIITKTQKESWQAEGKSFSYEDYLVYGALETKRFVVDPTSYMAGIRTPVPFNRINISSTSGPITIDFYAGVDVGSGGTELTIINRRGTSDITPLTTITLNPVINSAGIRLAGDLSPSTESGPGGTIASGASNVPGETFEADNRFKYLFDVKNLNGADTYVCIKLTWFEP